MNLYHDTDRTKAKKWSKNALGMKNFYFFLMNSTLLYVSFQTCLLFIQVSEHEILLSVFMFLVYGVHTYIVYSVLFKYITELDCNCDENYYNCIIVYDAIKILTAVHNELDTN